MTDAREGDVDPRIAMAADRTILARERTYAAWMRTGLAALATGVGARTLLKDDVPAWLALAAGIVLATFAGFCFVAAVWRELAPGFQDYHPADRKLPPAVFVAVSGFLVLLTAAVLAGIVAAR